MVQQWKQKTGLYWTVILSVLLFGGFYDWATSLLGIVTSLSLIKVVSKKGFFCYTKEKWFLLFIGLFIMMGGGVIYGLDSGMSMVGVIRFIPVVLWGILCMQYSSEERKEALEAVADVGVVMVLVGIVAYIFPQFRQVLWSADRLGGFFQYSNTCAVFFLLGMTLVERKDLKSKIKWSLLFGGILLTGSRIVMIITLVYILLQLIHKKTEKSWKYFLLGNLMAGLLAAVIVVMTSGSFQNIARLATIFTSNSTLYGRLLYWQDALGLIIDNPLGLGYMGYYYIQPLIQTGVYTTMYVHNDFLQWFLDSGWIGGLTFLVLMILQLIKSDSRKALVILLIHCMADFDFQYTSIWMVAILLFDFGKIKIYEKKNLRNILCFPVLAVMALCFYFTIPFSLYNQGNYKQAISMFPAYTRAKEALLALTGDADEAEVLADEILSANPYITTAHDAKAMIAYVRGNIKEFSYNKERVLEIARYDITHYRDYNYILEQYKAEAMERGNDEEVEFCIKKQKGIMDLLKELERETSYLAWKIRDKPEFTL